MPHSGKLLLADIQCELLLILRRNGGERRAIEANTDGPDSSAARDKNMRESARSCDGLHVRVQHVLDLVPSRYGGQCGTPEHPAGIVGDYDAHRGGSCSVIHDRDCRHQSIGLVTTLVFYGSTPLDELTPEFRPVLVLAIEESHHLGKVSKNSRDIASLVAGSFTRSAEERRRDSMECRDCWIRRRIHFSVDSALCGSRLFEWKL